MDEKEIKIECLHIASELYKYNADGNTACLSADEIVEHAAKFYSFVNGESATKLKLVKDN
jgi:hypothetical protein